MIFKNGFAIIKAGRSIACLQINSCRFFAGRVDISVKTAAAYIRVSTDDQVEFSPDSQLEKIKLYAERNQILLPKEFIFLDEGISGRNAAKRPAFNEMIGLAKRKPKPFDMILVWKYSRFARNREDSVVYKSMLRKDLNIDVVSISEDVGDDKMSILFEAMIEAMDEYYSINLAEEVKRGMTEKAKRGGVLSIPPFGYRTENNAFVTVPEEAEIIRKVFSDYIHGKGLLTIAKELNAMGVKTHRGNRIENRTVEYWLNNPIYIGKTRWNPDGKLSRNYDSSSPIISDGTHEPIIDEKTWEKVRKRVKERKNKFGKYYNSDRKNLSHWLTGIARCGKCGAVLSNQGGYFGCSNRGRGTCGGVGYISAKKLDKIILSALSDLTLPNATLEFTEVNAETHSNDDEKIISARIQRLKIRLERVKNAYEGGADTLDEYKASKKNILDEMDNLNNLLQSKNAKVSKSEPLPEEKLRRLKEILGDDGISNTEKNRIARTIFKEIVKCGDDGKTLKCVFWR